MSSLNDVEKISELSFTLKQTVGALIIAFDSVGYNDAMDVAAIVLEFENQLKRLPLEEAEAIFNERWDLECSIDNKFEE